MNVLEISGLKVRFGDNAVLRGLDLCVPEGSVFGFVGQNGAGKTTTMKAVLGLLEADGGDISVCGERVAYGRTKTNRHIGYLPDVPEFYGYMRPMEYLSLCGGVAMMDRSLARERAARLLDMVGLAGVNKKIGSFSRGMKQRLGIAQALLHEPRLLICDEPTSALDPVGRKEVLDIMSSVRGGATVLFSTHILSDVERICDRVAVLHDGVIALEGPLEEIKRRRKSGGFAVDMASDADADTLQSDPAIAAVADIKRDGPSMIFRFPGDAPGGRLLIERIAALGLVPVRIEALEPTLESLFLEVVQ